VIRITVIFNGQIKSVRFVLAYNFYDGYYIAHYNIKLIFTYLEAQSKTPWSVHGIRNNQFYSLRYDLL
jgi:hypothetical protein